MKSILTRISLLALYLFLFFPIQSQAATEKRIALVIGNSNYYASPLRNPVNDATDMAVSLKMLGFNVILKTNAAKRDMGKAVEDFGKRLKGGDVGLFYYAGHGVQVNGVNYLIPVGAKINDETDVEYEAIDAGRILSKMYNAKSTVNIVILDACRDNPYVWAFRSATRGLAIISKAPSGTIISYSTSPGDVALDGKGRNSPYTSALLHYMKESGLTIEQVFKNVRQKIDTDTAGKQTPWELSSLKGDFYFNPQKGIKTVEETAGERKTATPDLDEEQRKVDEEKQRLEKEEALIAEKAMLEEKRRQLEEKKKQLAAVKRPSFLRLKSYQVTGPVVAVKEDTIIIQKGREQWEIARDASAKATDDLKIGSKVKIVYSMKAIAILVRNE